MAGFSSRRKAEELILGGEVTVNGQIVTDLSTKVTPSTDRVTVRGKTAAITTRQIYLVLNKPTDYITTAHDERNRKTVFDLVRVADRVFPIGRLDRNTSGVLLFTNDGDLAYHLMHPSSEIEKTYLVKLEESVKDQDIRKLETGVHLSDGKTAPARVEVVPSSKNREILITIHEGKNKQVRRMFESFGYEIEKLHRLHYAGITVRGLKRGQWRSLSAEEIRHLKNTAGLGAERPPRKSSARHKRSR